MRFVTALLLLLVMAPPARAEIHLHDSVEWLCARSVVVASGTLTAVSPETPSDGQGKSRDLVSLTLAPTRFYRGGPKAGERLPPVHFSLRVQDTQRLMGWMKDRTEVVVFLDETVQAYRREGITYSHWPVRETGTQQPMLVALARPHVHLLSAGEMDHAHSPAAIATACDRVAAIRPAAPLDAPPGPHFLEVPSESPAYGALYEGSSCYLYVPVGVFKAARPSL